MRHVLLTVILLTLVMPVSAQGDDDPLYTIDSEGWFIIADNEGDIFYSNVENIEPIDGWEIMSLLSPGDIVVAVQIEPLNNIIENTPPSDPTLFMGIRFGTWLTLNAIARKVPIDAKLTFGDISIVTFDDIEFVSTSISIGEAGVYTTYAHLSDEYGIFLDIYHDEETDIEQAVELLETIEFLSIDKDKDKGSA